MTDKQLKVVVLGLLAEIAKIRDEAKKMVKFSKKNGYPVAEFYFEGVDSACRDAGREITSAFSEVLK